MNTDDAVERVVEWPQEDITGTTTDADVGQMEPWVQTKYSGIVTAPFREDNKLVYWVARFAQVLPYVMVDAPNAMDAVRELVELVPDLFAADCALTPAPQGAEVERLKAHILAASDALRDGDPDEAYHQLYAAIDPDFSTTGKGPFEKLRAAQRPQEPSDE